MSDRSLGEVEPAIVAPGRCRREAYVWKLSPLLYASASPRVGASASLPMHATVPTTVSVELALAVASMAVSTFTLLVSVVALATRRRT